jgi:hypothetical protein
MPYLQYDQMMLKHIPKEEFELRLAVQFRTREKELLTRTLQNVKSYFEI